jgi:hypothetical protein
MLLYILPEGTSCMIIVLLSASSEVISRLSAVMRLKIPGDFPNAPAISPKFAIFLKLY